MKNSPGSRILEKMHSEGCIWLLKAFFRRFIYKEQRFILLYCDITSEQKKYKPSPRWLIRELTPEDLDKTDKYLLRYKSAYRDLLAQGCKAFAAFETGTGHVIGIACFTGGDFHDNTHQYFKFHVKPHQIYQFAGEVALPYRNTAVSIHVLQAAWEYWRGQSKTESYCSVDLNNIPSIRFHLHLTFREKGQMITLHRLLGVKWSRLTTYHGQKLEQYQRRKITE